MDDHNGKEWVLTQVKRRYKKLKTKQDGYTQSQLISYAVRERKRICKADGGTNRTKFEEGYRRLRGATLIEEIPPGEDKIRKYVRQLEKDGMIEFCDLKPAKKSKRTKKKNDHGGGRGNRRIMMPTKSGDKIRHNRGRTVLTLLNLVSEVKKFREMELDKIGIKELSHYVTLKNKIFRFPVEYADNVKSETLSTIFDYVQNEVVAICADIDRKMAENRKIHTAHIPLRTLASSNEFLYKAVTRIKLERDDLSIAKYVNVVRELK